MLCIFTVIQLIYYLFILLFFGVFLQFKIKLFTVQEYKVGEKIAFFKKSILKLQLIVLQLFGLFFGNSFRFFSLSSSASNLAILALALSMLILVCSSCFSSRAVKVLFQSLDGFWDFLFFSWESNGQVT